MNLNIKQLRTLHDIIEDNAQDIELEKVGDTVRVRVEYNNDYIICFEVDKDGNKQNFTLG